MTDTERPSYLRGAAILGAAAVVAKIIGALFKIPLYNLLSDEATGDFNITYNVYALLLTISYAGIPVAMSRLVSTSRTLGNTRQMRKYFRVALPAFSVVGIAVSLVMFIFAGQFAALMEDPNAVYGIRMLSPAVFLCCVISVYEGYFQGHGDMLPTAVKQLIEVTSKLLFGLVIAWLLIRGGAPDEKVASGAITGVVFGLAIALPVLIGYKRRAKREPLAGTARSNLGTLASILKVSVPITLGASFMSIMALLDSKVVMSRLQSASGAGFDLDTARGMFGVYAQCLTLYNLMPSLITAVTISVVPAISAAIAAKRRSEARAIGESALKLICIIAMPAAIGISVMAHPIYNAVYGAGDGGALLRVFGPASFFCCMQLYTTAMLQASGLERAPMITFPLGGALMLVIDYILVGNREIGILGSPYGTLACFAFITLMNFIILAVKSPARPRLIKTAGKPLVIAGIMGVAAFAVHGLLSRLLAGNGRGIVTLRLLGTVAVAAMVYLVLIVYTKTITKEDLALVPRGDKLAKLLRL